jgi:hypothetical protein
MTYGNISFEQNERVLATQLLEAALIENEALQGATHDDDEVNFYRNVRPVLQSTLDAVNKNAESVPFTEGQLQMLKGLLSLFVAKLRMKFQEARISNSSALEDINRQWAIRDGLAAKLEAPFVEDTSCDAEEGLFEEE